MSDYCYVNSSKMVDLCKSLDGSEIKMLFGIMYCINTNNSQWFINNQDNRKLLASIGFDKTPERISALLGSLTKKGALDRKANGVYAVQDGLILEQK